MKMRVQKPWKTQLTLEIEKRETQQTDQNERKPPNESQEKPSGAEKNKKKPFLKRVQESFSRIGRKKLAQKHLIDNIQMKEEALKMLGNFYKRKSKPSLEKAEDVITTKKEEEALDKEDQKGGFKAVHLTNPLKDEDVPKSLMENVRLLL